MSINRANADNPQSAKEKAIDCSLKKIKEGEANN